MAARAKAKEGQGGAKVQQLLLNHKDFAEVVGVPTLTLLRWAKNGKGGCPPPVRVIDRTYLFDRRVALAWVRSRLTGADLPPG